MAGDFDQWLRDLVSDSVSVTPPPPELDGRASRPTQRRPWLGWALGGAAAAAVIALIVAFTVTSGDDDNVTTAPVTDPSTSLAPATSAAGTVAPETSAPPRSTTTTMAPSTTAAPLVPPTVPTFQPEPVPSVVTAGDDGVWVTAGAERVRWVDEPMSRAAWADDGLIVQRNTGYGQGWSEEDTALFKVTAPGGELEPFLDDLDLGDTPWIELHDTALIEGEQRVLLTLLPPIESIESPAGRLVVTSPDGTFDVLDDAFIGWESGSSRMSMSTTGLVIGEISAEVFRGYVGYSIGDTPAPTRAELGLPADDFQDCGDCPRLYTVSDDGTTIAWLDGTELMRWDVTARALRPRIALGSTAEDAGGLAVTDGAVVMSAYEGQPTPAELVTLTGTEPDGTLLSAPSAAFGPDAFTTPFLGATDFPGGVGTNLAGGQFTENEVYALLLGVIETQVQGSPADCEDVPRTITRLDDQTIRVRIGCDDAGIGIDYRLDRVGPTPDGGIGAQVLRRSVCGRGVSDGLCV